MANYKLLTDFLNDLRATPGEENLIYEDGICRLNQDYAIARMNAIFGKGNWSIREVKNELLKSSKNNTAQNVCTMTVEYKHPISEAILTSVGIAPMNFAANEAVMEGAFLNAISKLGITFGEGLNVKTSTATVTELPRHSNKLAAVI